jgi:hypothetical protein
VSFFNNVSVPGDLWESFLCRLVEPLVLSHGVGVDAEDLLTTLLVRKAHLHVHLGDIDTYTNT